MNQIVRQHTRKRTTKRRLMNLWYNVIDIAALNAYTIFTQIKRNNSKGKVNNARQLFVKELAKQRVMPNMERQKEFLYILRTTVDAMERCGLRFGQSTGSADYAKLSKRKRCYFCNHSKDRKESLCCSHCCKPVSSDHSSRRSVIKCYNCKDCVI